MLVAERHQKILELVNRNGSIRVTELSKICDVTEETIRRDLSILEKQGKLMRSHGGAVSVEGQRETPFFEREIMNVEEKKAIAKRAIEFISPGEKIILDASTTAWYMAGMIPDIPLTVITNSIRVVQKLSNKEHIEVISTGGVLTSRSMSFIGPMAEKHLDLYHANKVFISCKGVDTKNISESNVHQAAVKQKMIDNSDEVYLLADYSKIGEKSLTVLASLDRVDYLITDKKVNKQFIEEIQGKDIRPIIV